MFETCLKMVVMVVVVVVVGGGAASTQHCQLNTPSWTCTADPLLTVYFEKTTVQDCGGTADKGQFTTLLALLYPGANETRSYTVAMVDPDAPGHHQGQAYVHLLKAGVSGGQLQSGGHLGGNTIMDYRRPTPPKGTGLHRYVFYVYEEPPLEEEQEPGTTTFPSVQGRPHFHLHDFARSQGLCGPVAHNMFLTGHMLEAHQEAPGPATHEF